MHDHKSENFIKINPNARRIASGPFECSLIYRLSVCRNFATTSSGQLSPDNHERGVGISVVRIWESLVVEWRMVHLERRTKTEGEKRDRAERDGKKVPGLGIAHFGKALMQSRLGSAYVPPGAFNDTSLSSSSSSWSSSSLHPFDRSRCIPRDIATVVPLCSSRLPLFIAAGSQASRTNGSMTRRERAFASPPRTAFGMCVFKSVSATVHDTA
ncbi:hypothetical protein ALC62_00907 [Cyphomyrmex costatus]|uniref:Uncharacterized protein n=1 Tax=Cyphomyrmex costatus TaxID=456900 RepID=A0A195D5B5_9HYME|nr:hypothetical protein ALC62_00907 [Cyphomyrmex costatus]